MKCEDNGLDRLKVLFARVLAALMLVTLLTPAAMAEEAKMDGFYDLKPLIGEREGASLLAITIEHVNVNSTMYTTYSAIGRQLPDGQADVGLVFSITGNPNPIVFLDVRCL